MKDNFISQSAARFKEERERLGMDDQATAAKLCGVSREMWGKYERAKSVPGGEVLFSFAAQGADVQYILTGERSVKNTPNLTAESPRLLGKSSELLLGKSAVKQDNLDINQRNTKELLSKSKCAPFPHLEEYAKNPVESSTEKSAHIHEHHELQAAEENGGYGAHNDLTTNECGLLHNYRAITDKEDQLLIDRMVQLAAEASANKNK